MRYNKNTTFSPSFSYLARSHCHLVMPRECFYHDLMFQAFTGAIPFSSFIEGFFKFKLYSVGLNAVLLILTVFSCE